jgi:hypothetical protein
VEKYWRCRLRLQYRIVFSKILILLFILVAGLLTVFGYYASSICITVVLAGFLAILFDPAGSPTGEVAFAVGRMTAFLRGGPSI